MYKIMQRLIPDLFETDNTIPKYKSLKEYKKYIDSLKKKNSRNTTIFINFRKVKFLQTHIKPDEKIIDYGGGNGMITGSLPNTVLGLERNDLKEVHEDLKKQGKLQNTTFLYDTMDFPLDGFDSIVFLHVIHHLKKSDFKKILERLNKSSIKKIVLLEHDCKNKFQVDILLLQHYIYEIAFNETSYYTKFWSYKDMKNFIESYGWKQTHYKDTKRHDYSYESVFEKS